MTNGWIERRITVACDSAGGTKKIKAEVYGPLAVHKALDTDLWCVTVISVGYRIIAVPDKDDAIQIAEELLSKPLICKALSQKTCEKIIENLLIWVKPWLQDCYRAQRYISPTITSSGFYVPAKPEELIPRKRSG